MARGLGATNTGKPAVPKQSICSGAAADTDITLTGIRPGRDQITSVIRFDVAADSGSGATGNKLVALSDLTSEVKAVSKDHFQLETTDTSGDQLLVSWIRAS